MLFRQDILQGIADGRVTLAFRRWRKAPPADGFTLRTPIGVLCLEHVRVIDDSDITPSDVQRTGMTLDALRASLEGDGTLLRMELRLAGDDPRIALRQTRPGEDDLAAIAARLDKFDAAARHPWTAKYLGLIAANPGTVARELAPKVNSELPPFKRRVRQLKELGLTESLEVGYRLSPRGVDVLAKLTGPTR
jgi:hypothetical protein